MEVRWGGSAQSRVKRKDRYSYAYAIIARSSGTRGATDETIGDRLANSAYVRIVLKKERKKRADGNSVHARACATRNANFSPFLFGDSNREIFNAERQVPDGTFGLSILHR